MKDLDKKIIELMDLFDDEQVTTAEKIDRPERAIEKQAIDDFMKRNPMVGGGRIGFGDGSVTPIKQGKNKGKFHLRLGSGKFRKTYIGTEKELNKIFENRRRTGGDTTKGLENKKYKKNFLPRNKFLNFLKNNNIKAETAANFAERYGIKREPNPFNKNQFIYSTEQFNKNFIDDIMKRQVATGQATDFAKKKFPVKTKTELQAPRLDAIEAQGGIRKNDPFAAPRGSGAQLGHTGNIFGTELITGDRLAYTPSQVNELMSRKGNLDDKIRTVSAKIENIKKSNKSPKVKKDLLEQADNILIRLASQSQGFKKVTLSDGGTFGGDRLTLDPFDIYKGKTEKEIVQLQKQYLNKPIITKEMAAKNPNLKVTSPEETAKIQDAYFFEENRKASLKTAQDFPKQELNKIISELENPNQIRLARIGCPGKATGGRIGYFEGQNLTTCAAKGIQKLQTTDVKKLTPGDQKNIKAITKTVQGGRILKNVLGPGALAFEGLFAAPFAAYDYARGRRGEDIFKSALSLGLLDQKLTDAELKKIFPEYGQAENLQNIGERLTNLERLQKGTRGQKLRSKPKFEKAEEQFETALQPFLDTGDPQKAFLENIKKSQEAQKELDRQYEERAKDRTTQFDLSDPFMAAKGGRASFSKGSLRKGIQALIGESVKKTPKDITPDLDKLIKKALDEDFFDKKDRIIDNINAKIFRAKAKGLDSQEIGEGQIEFYDDITKSNFRTKTGPFFDRRKRAGGGILKQAGDSSGPPPESGPNSQGLQGLMKRGIKT
jgi:hypothetical protein